MVKLIILAKQKDQEAILKLIDKFNPLLKKYAYLLKYEDALQDLIIFFIDLLYKIPDSLLQNYNEGKIVVYIEKSVKHQYVYMSKKICRSNKTTCNSETETALEINDGKSKSLVSIW